MTDEPDVPFDLPVLYEDENIVVVDKPHFLATMPRGMWYRQTALIRMRERLGEPQLVPAHRLDRLTAGVLVLVRRPGARGAYQMLFQEHYATKTYECLAPIAPVRPSGVGGRPFAGTVTPLEPPRPFPLVRRSHIVKHRGTLQAHEEPGDVNAESLIERDELVGRDGMTGRLVGRYTLRPRTGKTHQLRVHMASLGLPIVGDDLYPTVRRPDYADFSRPLQLVARRLEFADPVTGEERVFVSRVPLGA
ncbi:pseudouridine synthase [Bifidobacterium choloepi]|uniref:pseudouridine synthase n=1 Tax=Bifidobacterium choloepi TaxID=2614131 RepID=UPI002F2B87F2